VYDNAVFLPEHRHFSGLAITRPYRPDRGRMLYLWSRNYQTSYFVIISAAIL
jgi:hypothetical protein